MSEQTLEGALVAAQNDLPKVEPDALNPHFKSKFVSLDHLIAKTRPVLNKHGLALTQYVTITETGPVLNSSLVYSSGARMDLGALPLILAQNNMQQLGAAITYARRYAWAAILGISEQEDDDGNQVSAGRPVDKPSPGEAKAGGGTPPPSPATFAPPPGVAASKEDQAKVSQLYLTLAKEKAISEEQFVNACSNLGARADTWAACVPLLTREGATSLIGRLENLAKRKKAAA